MEKKTLYKIFITIFMTLGMMFILKTTSNASTLSVSPSKSSVSPGESFSITVSVGGGAGKVSLSASNATLSATSLELMTKSSQTVTATAGASGTISISASGVIADYSTETDEQKSASASVSIVSQNNGGGNNTGGATTGNGGVVAASTNANLSNLGITPNDFSGFSAGKTSYSVNVPNEVSQITIYANKGDSGQTITGTGAKTLREGTNRFNIVVKAAAGNTKTYTISVNRATLEGENVPNTDGEEDEANPEENNIGIVLENLEIEGLKLEPEFDPAIKEYTVKLDKKINSLEELKKMIKSKFSDENYTVEVLTEDELKEDKNVVYVIIKDAEREYARYTITFVNEEAEAKLPEVQNNDSQKDDDTFSILGCEFDKDMIPIFIMSGCTLLAVSIGILIAIIAFIKSKKLKKYESYEDDYFDENENTYTEINNSLDDVNTDDDTDSQDETESRNRKAGYRSKAKKSRGSGRHF